MADDGVPYATRAIWLPHVYVHQIGAMSRRVVGGGQLVGKAYGAAARFRPVGFGYKCHVGAIGLMCLVIPAVGCKQFVGRIGTERQRGGT